jgi:signal transduction histidine kinase
MSEADASSKIYEELRGLSFEDPLGAKRIFTGILEGDDPTLRAVLDLAAASGDGRVRQVIARVAQKHPRRGKVVEALASWKETETDEFALSAIDDALKEIGGRHQRSKLPAEFPDLSFTFRFLSGRLRHRVLNILPRAGISVNDLRDEIKRIGGDELLNSVLPMLDDMHASLRRLERAVSFEEEESYFTPARILLPDWLKTYYPKYQAQYGRIGLRLDFGPAHDQALVKASPFLLETVFLNLWNNSKQTVEGDTEVTLSGAVQGTHLVVNVVDNGGGFTSSDPELAFRLQYSKKRDAERGRGHMEVDDAMRRLGGDASVRPVPGHGYRVVLTFRRSK